MHHQEAVTIAHDKSMHTLAPTCTELKRARLLRETVTAKSIAFAFTAVYIVMKFGLDLAEDYILAGSSDSLN